MPRRCWAATLALLILMSTTSCSLFRDDYVKVKKSGGTAASDDGKVTVTFSPGQLPADTKVTISQDKDGPAPVPGFVPLARPFDITLDQRANGGTVTSTYQPPAGITVDPDHVAMFIEDNGTWVLVPSNVDATRRTVTGTWPHFSKGHVAFFNPILAADDAAGWSWDRVKDGAGWIVDRGGDVARGIAAGAVGLTGGTTDTARCESNAQEWTVENSAGMSGCVDARGEDSMWPAKVNDRYPYPLVADLPDGTVGPGVFDLLDTHDPIELALAMILSRHGKLAVPAGATVPFKLAADAPRTLRLNAKLDSGIVAIKTLGLLAIALTRGATSAELSAMRAQLNAVEKDLWTGFIAARRNRSTTYTLAEYIRDTEADNSLVQQRRKLLAHDRNDKAVNDFFDKVELINCGATLISGAVDAGLSFTKQLNSFTDKMIDHCFGVYVKAAVTHQYEQQMKLLNPSEQLKYLGHLTTGLLEQAKDLRSSVAVSISGLIDTLSLGTVDSATASVTLNRPIPRSRLTGVNWEIVAGPRLNCGGAGVEQFFATVHHDITGDEIPDSFVLLGCVVGAGRSSDHLLIFDGASDPASPRLLGERPPSMPGSHFTGGCLLFDGKVVTMLSREYGPNDPSSSPTIGVKVLAMWTGTRFDFGAPIQFPQPPDRPVQGCTTTMKPRR